MHDPYDADLLRHLADEISGPMAASVLVQARLLDAQGVFELTEPLREGAILLQLKRSVGDNDIEVQPRVTAPSPARNLPSLSFARWTEVGCALPLLVEPANAVTELLDPARIRIRATRNGTPIPVEELANWFDIQLLSGRLAKLLYVIQAETAQVRRHAHAIKAARNIAFSRGEALDRHGRDLGVHRFRSGLQLEADGQIRTVPVSEPDQEFRQRLALASNVSLPRRAKYRGLESAESPLSELGPKVPIKIEESDNPFSAAIAIVAVDRSETDAAKKRKNFLTFLEDWILVDPQSGLPTRRRMSREDARRERAQRALISDVLNIDRENIPLAPELAECFERLSMLIKSSEVAGTIRLIDGFALDTTQSRYELGLGAQIASPSPSLLEDVADAVTSGIKTEDARLSALLKSVTVPDNPAADPSGRWLLEPCGFKTVHQLDDGRLYVSHTTVNSLEVLGERHKARTDNQVSVDFTARFTPSGGGEGTALFNELILAATSAFTGATRVGNGLNFIAGARAPTAAQARRLRAAGLPEVEDWQAVHRQLGGMPASQWGVLRFSGAFATNLEHGRAAAWRELEEGLTAIRQSGLAAAVPIFTGSNSGLLLSAVSIPKIGFNISGKAATGVRWFVVPLDKRASSPGSASDIFKITRPSGFETSIRFREDGLYAVVALGYERRGDTDPYEVRALPVEEDAVLNYAQYEFLMNFLSMRAPIGVEINTWRLRQFHVASEDGSRRPLGVAASQSFRRFHNPSQAGSQPSTPPIARGE